MTVKLPDCKPVINVRFIKKLRIKNLHHLPLCNLITIFSENLKTRHKKLYFATVGANI
jgi:hypothetical protein